MASFKIHNTSGILGIQNAPVSEDLESGMHSSQKTWNLEHAHLRLSLYFLHFVFRDEPSGFLVF